MGSGKSGDEMPEMLWPVVDLEGSLLDGRVSRGVLVWGWSLLGEEGEAEKLFKQLSAEERERAERFVFRRDWRRYVMAHAGMRRVLGAELGRGEEEIVLAAGAYGKPCVVGEEGLGFNLTHSANVALLAVGWGVAVGVDVEEIREHPAGYPLDQLSAQEGAYLRGLPGEVLGLAFHRCWTRKEALLKGAGIGLQGGLDQFSVLPEWDRAVVLPGASAGVAGLEEWRLRELAPAVGYTGCLAVRADSVQVQCFRLGRWGA